MHLRSIGVGLDALGANRLRTLLSTSGVVIGVASLVAVLAVGDGIERFAREQIGGTTDIQFITVTPKTTVTVDGVRLPGSNFPSFAPSDADAIAREVPGVDKVFLMLTGSARFVVHDSLRAAMIVGTYTSSDTAVPMLSGRALSREEQHSDRRVAVISNRLAALLGSDSLVLEKAAWPVVGVIKDQPRDSVLRITVPVAAAASAMVPAEWPRAPTLLVRAARLEAVEDVRAALERWLAARNPAWPAGVTFATNTGRLRQVQQGARIFKLFMGAITGISLLVGGIGIMNVLLASVAERTREIGIRKATGARPRDVLVQFLAESITITGSGSLLGVALGLAGAFSVTAFMRSQTRATIYAGFTWSTVAVAVGSAVVVGIAFGMYPALRASRLSPVDAIRHE
ncbi:MAG TPA: ABC transporter permease [Gemmatimonadaceae bacterium]|jgi:putative ABC transport system permease protein